MDYQELILGFVGGLFTGFVVEYLRHSFSMRRLKKKQFLPYLRQLYGAVSRIMEKTHAKELSKRYDRLINAKIEEKMRESAYRELMDNENIRFPELMRPSFVPYHMFLLSYNSLIEVIRECRRFESIYTEMEKKGLIPTLEVHHRRLCTLLSSFHSSASYIVRETTEIVDNLVTAYELKDGQEIETIFEENVFKILRRISTHNLFNFGSQLQKQLRKLV